MTFPFKYSFENVILGDFVFTINSFYGFTINTKIFYGVHVCPLATQM